MWPQLAIQSGRKAAENIIRRIEGKPSEPFRYVDKGSMATIGRNKAVAQVGRFEFSGALAWWFWLIVHVLALVDFRRKTAVLVEWAWAYFSWQRRSRVILEVPAEPLDPRTSSYVLAGRASLPAAPRCRSAAACPAHQPLRPRGLARRRCSERHRREVCYG